MSDFGNFEHLFDAVVILNLKQEVIHFNHQATIFFKLPPRILKQKKNLLQICDSSDFDIENWLSKGALSFEVMISPEIKLTLPNDPETECYVILKMIPVQTNNGASLAIVFHDKTVETKLHAKYREQLEELKKTHNQILQADKLATLGELTATISHEINNPLTIAAGHSELIKDYLSSNDPFKKLPLLQKANQTVTDSLERVNQIIKNMKDFLHQNEEKKEYCDLSELIDSSVEWIRPTAQKAGVRITKNINQSSVSLVNRIKLEQVIINLIKNSIDAITDSKSTDGEIIISLTHSTPDQKTCIHIRDNGPGIPNEMKENLFKPFHSTKDSGHGTGLGLSICSKIIESHHGTISHLESESGCEFVIKLPLIELYSYSRNDKSLTGNKKQKRILVLDNEVQILNVLNTFITDENLVFIGSSNPLDAIAFLEKASVDLIITDFNMPLMNGSEFSAKIRQDGYDGPILYMTSAKNIHDFNKDKTELGIMGLILKPFTREDVMKTISAALKSSGGSL